MSVQKTWKIAGINFDHMHMGDLLRMAMAHPRARIVGVQDADRARMQEVIRRLGLPDDLMFDDYARCLEQTRPDIVILCPGTAAHAEWTEKVAPCGAHIIMEKPFAASLADADRMIAAVARTGKQLAINWPLRWYRSHVTAHRLVREGRIGQLIEVHYYDGNRGPVRHVMDKIEVSDEEALREKSRSWWYRRSAGGGSLLDYLGYGTTLGTWFFNGKAPIEVTSMVDQTPGLEVDEHSITIARYDVGLSKFETRWGSFTDPWTHQPQPKCGFVLVGREGTLSSYDYENHVRLQTRQTPQGVDVPADELQPPNDNPINYVISCLDRDAPVDGPLSPAIARIGQQIVDSAMRSSQEKRTVPLVR